jgi:Prohead core protein serine protease
VAAKKIRRARNNMYQIQDVFILEGLKVINEGKSGPLKIRGIFQRADEANNNGRVYPRSVLDRQVKALTEAISERRLVGELDHPTYDMVKLSNASHLITGLRLEGNEVIGEAEILPTPAGKVVEGLIRGGVKIGISSRGMGTLSEGRDGTKTVNEDFKLLTFDVVADPSTRGAFPTISESKEYKKDKQIIESTLKNVIGERYFLKLLEKKIDEKLNEVKGDTIARRLSGLGADLPTEKGYERAQTVLSAKPGSSTRQAGVRAARANVPEYPKKNKK